MRMSQGLVLAMGTYFTLLNSANLIEGRYVPEGYIALGMFVPHLKVHLKYYI